MAINKKPSKKNINQPSCGVTYNLNSHWVDSVFKTLTEDEKIAQLFMIAAYSDSDKKHQDRIEREIKTIKPGGLVFFQGGPFRQAQQTNYYQAISRTPLLIGIDGEWGLGMRLDSTMSFPRQMMLGAVNNDSLIFKMGYEIARQLKSLGIHVNFAPVVDINNNPDNPVISNRSFGDNKYEVARKSISYMNGLQANGIIAIAKHFPGHGDTNADSHTTLPVLDFDYNRLDSFELYPFREMIKQNVGGIMVAHLFVTNLDSAKNTASSLSKKVVTGLLKDSLHFKGLIFTDALNMEGVAGFYRPGEIEVKALMAGNDILLMPKDPELSLSCIQEAISSGLLRQSQIDSSCRKILAAKEWAGLTRVKPIDVPTLNQKLNTSEASLLQRKIIESALTIIKNENNLIPLKRLDTLKIALVLLGEDKTNQFKETLSLYDDIDCYFLNKMADSARIDSLIKILHSYNLIIAGVHHTSWRPARNFGITSNEIAFLETLASQKSVILDLFATPYAINYFKRSGLFKSVIVSYEDKPLVEDYSAQLIFGGVGAKGTLPVCTEQFNRTTGLETENGLRLKYSIPEELNIDGNKLAQIDTIVDDAIRKRAMPGCVVLVAKDGIVFYHKAFGYHTYDKEYPVLKQDIYDLASVTKITATLPVVMKLYEEKKISLTGKISSFLPYLKSTNKKDITLIDMLTHQARLQPFIPFYWRLLEPAIPGEKLTSNEYSAKYPIKLASHLFVNINTDYKKGLVKSFYEKGHQLEVADNIFLLTSYRDTILNLSNNSPLLPKKEYKYSDMDFYYMYWMAERLTGKPLNEYVKENFYDKLGAETTDFLPLKRFDIDRIAPTENDQVFRKQLVHGYVHDPGAAMMGGVCGHAGLFSNANDLAKIMQMYLNKGVYGGEQYFKASTLDYFSSSPFIKTNHRGIGFDKPIMNSHIGPTCMCVSDKSYGHTGFTGIMTWVDPQSGLLYIFLSNRVYPNADNIKLTQLNVRTRIQEVVAESMNTYK